MISNLIQTQLAAAGLTAKVQGYPTSEIYGWIGTDGQAAPEIFASYGVAGRPVALHLGPHLVGRATAA